MRLTRASSYALAALVYLTAQKSSQPTPSYVMAREQGLPERFLLKVLKPLVSARLLHSVKGPHGGYRLARSANAITLLEVVELVDGPIRGEVPAFQADAAGPLYRRLEAICADLVDLVRRQLQKVSLQDLTGKGKAK